MTSDFQSGLPVNILRGITPTATLWDGQIGYAYLDDGGVFTDDTVDANDVGAGDVDLMPAVPVLNDAFYFGEGFATSGTFNSLKITISQAGVGGTGIWEYYNGAAWVALNPTDATNGLTTAGASLQVSWTIPADMGHVAVNGQDRYWVRFRILTAYAPIAIATQIWLGRYPTSLSNTTDGDVTTVTDTGIYQGIAGDYGFMTWDMGAQKRVMFSCRTGVWETAGNVSVFVSGSNDGITFDEFIGSAFGTVIRGMISKTTEFVGDGYGVILNCRYIRLRFFVSSAATARGRVYEAYAYEFGV